VAAAPSLFTAIVLCFTAGVVWKRWRYARADMRSARGRIRGARQEARRAWGLILLAGFIAWIVINTLLYGKGG
jgi:hypothetical protein